MSGLRVTKVSTQGSCDVIEADFVFGPQRCHRATEWVTESDGEQFYVCEMHQWIAADAAAEAAGEANQ